MHAASLDDPIIRITIHLVEDGEQRWL